MDNFFSPIPTTTTTTTTSDHYFPAQCVPTTHESLQFPFAYPSDQTGPSFVIGVNSQPLLLSKEQEKRLVDAWMTKVARSKRKLARQRSLSLMSSTRNSTSCASSRGLAAYGADADVKNTNNNVKTDLYTFCTPDKKRLRVLLTKELKNSDVGTLGRIVLPKREAEENLPILSDKEGIQVVIRDVYSNQEWAMKYKYWSNNKSRMYVLENTVDFVKQNGLVIGDSITLYEDECKNLYVSIKKVERPEDEPSFRRYNTNYCSNYNYNYNNNNPCTPYTFEARDEEEASLALLIEQLTHKEEQEANSLATLSLTGASSHRQLA